MILLGLFAAILTTQAASPDHRIVGGVEVQPPGSYPHQGYLNRQVNGFSCGCVLVDDNITITAAHCVDGVDPSRVTVGFGAHDRVTKLEGEPLEYGIVQIAVHPNWTNSGAVGFPYDLAVMMMNMSAKVESPYIQPIPLPEPGRTPDDFEGKACVITGWGRPSAVGQPTNLLMEAQTQVINETLCQEQWSPQQVGDYHVCVWEPVDQDTGACNGDSGGPLVCTDDAGVTELVGLTSWGVSGCSPTFPSVYARVSFFREWIDGVLAEWTR